MPTGRLRLSKFTLVMPYYRNPEMLRIHVENWNAMSAKCREAMSVVLIDDGSPTADQPDDIFAACSIKKALYRIEQDIPFNAHGARNLGMKVMGRDNDWALMTDMDILLPEGAVRAILAKEFDPAHHYTIARQFRDGRAPKIHPNTFLLQRRAFWKVGGYDEDYCGSYGGDGAFARELERVASREHLEDVVSIGYNDTVSDCSTRDLDRKGPMKEEYIRRRDKKKKTGDTIPRNPLRFDWKQVY